MKSVKLFNFSIIHNVVFLLGALLSLIGLVDKLGFVDSIFFQYCFSVGIILVGLGVLLSGFDKKKKGA